MPAPSLLLPPPDAPQSLLAPVDDLTRRRVLVGGVSLALLAAAGCAGGDGGGASSGDRGATRTVTDPTGRRVDIPVDPQRIVALDPNRLIVDLVALGHTPVGATTNVTNPDGGLAPTLGDARDDIEELGPTGSADVERVVGLRPDLIFHAADYQDIATDTLSAIAPTIVYPRIPPGLREPTRWLGDLLGRAERAEQVISEFETLLDERRPALGLDGRTVAVVNLLNTEAGQNVMLLGPPYTEVFELLGATIGPDEVDGEPRGELLDVSLEVLPGALRDIDVLVCLVYRGTAEDHAADRTGSPLWEDVPAVARGDVVYTDIQYAMGHLGLDGLGVAFDDMADQLGT
jgi:iron complex transport system substrate-binding protein